MVAFNEISSTTRSGLFHVEVRSGGTPYQQRGRIIYIAQKFAGGAAAVSVPVLVASELEADRLFGAGSDLARMCRNGMLNRPSGEYWAAPMPDPTGAGAATGKIALAALPGGGIAGPCIVEIGGVQVVSAATRADTLDQIGTAFAAAISAALVEVEATYDDDDNEVLLTARHPGALGNDIDVYVPPQDNAIAAIATVTPMTGGTGTPTEAQWTTLLAGLGDEEFDTWGQPWADTVSLNAIKAEMDARWHDNQQIYGHMITAKKASVGALSGLGSARNNSHESIIGFYGSPTGPQLWCSSAAAISSFHLTDSGAGEISRPLRTLALAGVKPPRNRIDRFTKSNKETLLYDGISTFDVTRDGTVQIDRIITTYSQSPAGAIDWTWLNINQIYQAMFVVRSIRNAVLNAHGRQGLASTDRFDLEAITTPAEARATLIHEYVRLEAEGVVENSALFAQLVQVVRNGVEPDMLDVYLPFDVVNQLHVFRTAAVLFRQFPQQLAA
ncbi:phage tail sheath subtilisin-like domain-containing protein [Bosea sp. TWI1241]|uniref:phage tail sheath subtilisin-like domain-containing protein n=1 Tax=Bosea sp. TWI1241 TaxID=3148904 RepID=UPI0032094481